VGQSGHRRKHQIAFPGNFFFMEIGCYYERWQVRLPPSLYIPWGGWSHCDAPLETWETRTDRDRGIVEDNVISLESISHTLIMHSCLESNSDGPRIMHLAIQSKASFDHDIFLRGEGKASDA